MSPALPSIADLLVGPLVVPAALAFQAADPLPIPEGSVEPRDLLGLLVALTVAGTLCVCAVRMAREPVTGHQGPRPDVDDASLDEPILPVAQEPVGPEPVAQEPAVPGQGAGPGDQGSGNTQGIA